MPSSDCRITDDLNQTMSDIIYTLSGGNIGAVRVLMEWISADPMSFISLLTLDSKHLYDHHIWSVYKVVCGEDIKRFMYHVQMELPNQITGELSITGPYSADIDSAEHFAKRVFGKPGSYWALEHPPVEADYAYPIV